MLETHKNLILSNLPQLVAETDFEALLPELLRRGVFKEQIVRRILNPLHSPNQKKTDIYLQILKRGPGAFAELQDSLNSTNHTHLASVLEMQNESHFHRRSSLNSISSLGSQTSSDVNDIRSSCEKTSNHEEGVRKLHRFPQPPPTHSNPPGAEFQDYSTLEASTVQNTSGFDKRGRVFAPPLYQIVKGTPSSTSGEGYGEKFRPVIVKQSKSWPVQHPDSPGLYKMDSSPRGWALVITNITFDDADYPKRCGADNDEARLLSLLQQLHFMTEHYRNKTKDEMEKIVRDFSQKEELEKVDCVWVTLMSHGEEGESSEGAKILGTDGVGYSLDQVVANFYNNACPKAKNKPKIFTFQCCRGNLVDPGFHTNYARGRTESDGKRVRVVERERTMSDIIICFPSPPGMQANRDRTTGAWFIQAIVDVFSEYACTLSLDDLLKMVDKKIQDERNGKESGNFQTMTVQMIGWNKNLYFNPGLCWNPRTNERIRIAPPQANEMDTTDSQANRYGPTYLRLKDDKSEESSDEGKQGCFNRLGCNPI